MSEITLDLLRQSLPRSQRGLATQELVDRMNAAANGEEADILRENLLGYIEVLQEGKFKITDYISAVKYCSYKLMDKTNRTAWALTFPDRFTRLMADPTLCEEIDSYVTAYNKGKLVNLIMAQSLTPVSVLNAGLYQKVINNQFTLAMTAKSEMVRAQAGASLLNALKPPETQKVKVDVNVKHDSSVELLQEAMMKLVETQQQAIGQGVPLQQIAAQKLITLDEDVIDVE